MAPKRAAAAVVAQEDYMQDVVLVVAVAKARVNLALRVAPEHKLTPESVTDAVLAPSLHLEMVPAGGEHVSCSSACMGADACYTFNCQQKFKHKKGADIVDRLLNSKLSIRLVNSSSKVVLATADVDLLAMGLGSNMIQAELPLTAANMAATDDPFTVLPDSMIEVTLKLLHQTTPAPAGVEPTLEPFHAVPQTDTAACNVLEIIPGPAGPLPPRLAAAVAAANGALGFSLALHQPNSAQRPADAPPLAVVCSGGAVDGESLVWQKGVRTYLNPAAMAALRGLAEAGAPLRLEVARHLGPGGEALADPVFGAYHAVLELQGTDQLQEPGNSVVTGLAHPLGAFASVAPGSTSALPPYVAPAGFRPKTIEECPPAAPNAPPACAWLEAHTTFPIQLRLARPMYGPWVPPPKPSRSLHELLPPREPPPPPPQAPSAADEFRAQVKTLAVSLAQEYQQLAGSMPSRPSSGSNSSSRRVTMDSVESADDGAVAGEDGSAGALQQAMVFELNRSGKYLSLKERLKAAVVRIVQEQYKAQGAPLEADQLRALYNGLYVRLVDEMRGALAEAAGKAGTLPTAAAATLPAAAEDAADTEQQERDQLVAAAARLKLLADECEVAGEAARAAALHQERLITSASAEAWCDYGLYSMRSGAHGKAEECFGRALQLDERHRGSLTALLCLSLHHGAAGDATYLEKAEVMAHVLKEDHGGHALPWALLAMAYKAQGPAKESLVRSCHQEVVRLSKASLAAAEADSGSDSGDVNGYLTAAELLAELKLPVQAGQAMALAASTALKEAATKQSKQMKLCEARVAHLLGDSERAFVVLRDLQAELKEAGDEDIAALVLMADIQYETGALALAKQSYRRALQKQPRTCPQTVYLRLAHCFLASNDVPFALDMYQLACELAPSASSWLGLGVAHLRLGELSQADLALSEANILDNQHATVWGYLVLLSLMQKEEGEAEQAMKHAQRFGLDKPELLMEIADQYHELGRHRQAEALYVQVCRLHDSVQVRCKLAATLLAQHEYEACQRQLQEAMELPASSNDQAMLSTAVGSLQVAWPGLH